MGKSFAYLVPAILAAWPTMTADEPRRAAWSSRRTPSALQEQLIAKDLPLLNSVIPLEFSAVLVKGRHNYLSLRRLRLARRRGPSSLFRREEEFDHLRQLDALVASRPPTARWPISITSRLATVWDEVDSDNVNCMGRQCPTLQECFYYRARRRVQNAQILIVNHALFFSDLALRPQGSQHPARLRRGDLRRSPHLEAVASDHLGVQHFVGQIEYVLNKLYNERTKRGLLVHHKLADAQQEVQRCRYRADEFFEPSATGSTSGMARARSAWASPRSSRTG